MGFAVQSENSITNQNKSGLLEDDASVNFRVAGSNATVLSQSLFECKGRWK